MRRMLRAYTGRTVVVSVGGDTVRGTLQEVGRGALVLAGVEDARGGRIDGILVVPYPVVVQVV